jgi:thiamine biosynthesis lipoprotein
VSSKPLSSRRQFLRGEALRDQVGQSTSDTGEALLDGAASAAEAQQPVHRPVPQAGDMLQLETRAMACQFSVITNPVEHAKVWIASEALDLVHELEQLMTAYRDDSEMSRLNREAQQQAATADARLFVLLETCQRIAQQTDGAFDATSGPLIALWRLARTENRIPTEDEIAACLERVGMSHVELDARAASVCFDRPDVELNLGGIGKGFALDHMAKQLVENGLTEFLLHGGRSSVLACGGHNALGGWPVGIGNPLFTDQRLGTVLLQDQALSTSGSNIQYFRHKGQRYGHILDPRTGWPVEGSLSVTVIAESAATADALSTAFFVLGVEKAAACCHDLSGVGAILTPQSDSGRRVRPVVVGISDDQIFWESDDVDPVRYSSTSPCDAESTS